MPARGEEEVKWVHITDFSPGIVDPTGYTGTPGSDPTSVVSLGTATPDETVNCMAREDGSLGPIFKLIESYSETPANNNWTSGYRPTSAPYRWLLKTKLLPAIGLGVGTIVSDIYNHLDALFIAGGEFYDSANGGAYRKHALLLGKDLSYATAGVYTNIIGSGWLQRRDTTTSYAGSTLSLVLRSYLVSSVNIGSSAFTNYLNQSLFWFADSNGYDDAVNNVAQWHTFPDPEYVSQLPTRNIAFNAALATNQYGSPLAACSHQGRLVLAGTSISTTSTEQMIGLYQYNNGTNPSTISALTGETLSYAATPYVNDTGGAAATYRARDLIGADDWVITTMISVDGNTLFIAKMTGGGYLARADLDGAQVTKMASIAPTGQYYSEPTMTNLGVAYATATGIYLWGEGGQAEKISKNLDPQFWVNKEAAYAQTFAFTARGNLKFRDPYLFVPEGWFMNLPGQSWWRLQVTDTFPETPAPMNYEVSASGRLYAVPAYLSVDSDVLWHEFEIDAFEDAADATWVWKSHAIPDTLIPRMQNIRELVATISGYGTVQFDLVTVGDAGTTTSTTTFNIAGPPKTQRANVALHGVDTGGSVGTVIRITATGDGDGVLPTVHSVSLGIRQGQSTTTH